METKLVWRIDPSILPYVRESWELSHHGTGEISMGHDRRYRAKFEDFITSNDEYAHFLVGYVEVDRDEVRSRYGFYGYSRRVFTIRLYDLYEEFIPSEALLPEDVVINEGRAPYRARHIADIHEG